MMPFFDVAEIFCVIIGAPDFCRKSNDEISTGRVSLKTRAANALNAAENCFPVGVPESEPDICTVADYQNAMPLKGTCVRIPSFVHGPGCINTPGATPRTSGIREMNVSGLCGL